MYPSTQSYHSAEHLELKNGALNAGGGGPMPAVMSDEPPRLVNDVNCGRLLCPSCLTCCLTLVFPFCLCPVQVDVKTDAVLLSWGQFIGTIRKPGLYCINLCGTTVRKVSTQVNSMDVSKLKTVDSRGNPLMVSGVVNWEVRDSKRAVIDVAAYSAFLRSQAEVVLKQICSLHPYEAKPGTNEDSLKKEGVKIGRDVVELLQQKVSRAGISILDMNFSEVQYAPEIASQMLVRQQAEAMLDARSTVVNGAVSIAENAVRSLREKGIQMPETEAAKLASNLVITICSESRVTPTINLSA